MKMKKVARMICLVVLGSLVLTFALWRLVPRSFSTVFGPQMPQNMSVAFSQAGFETVDGELQPTVSFWVIESARQGDAAFDEIMSILQNAGYRPDIVNLLPWSPDSYESGTGDGTITVSFDVGGSMFGFSDMVTFQHDYAGCTCWHFADAAAFDELVNCIKTYGIEK